MNSCIPQVEVDGRLVTIKFEMPFMAGDACITPRQGHRTTVNMTPEVRIEMRSNLSDATVHFGGSWYSASHTQMHGVGEFLPDMTAFLTYWLNQPQEGFESRFAWLSETLRENPAALATLHAHRLNLLRAAIADKKALMAAEVLASARQINELEAALARHTEAEA